MQHEVKFILPLVILNMKCFTVKCFMVLSKGNLTRNLTIVLKPSPGQSKSFFFSKIIKALSFKLAELVLEREGGHSWKIPLKYKVQGGIFTIECTKVFSEFRHPPHFFKISPNFHKPMLALTCNTYIVLCYHKQGLLTLTF